MGPRRPRAGCAETGAGQLPGDATRRAPPLATPGAGRTPGSMASGGVLFASPIYSFQVSAHIEALAGPAA